MATSVDTLHEEKSQEDYSREEIPLAQYEYLDHPADIQLHSWGKTPAEAFEQNAMAMFGYMTEIDTVEMLDKLSVEAEGEDMLSLLFHFLDEWLFVFSAESFFIPRKIVITSFDKENFKISSVGYGETFDLSKHPQGSEVKAITYSNMQADDIFADCASSLFSGTTAV